MKPRRADLAATAYHESGHCVAAWWAQWPIAFVTIKHRPRMEPPSLGHVCWEDSGVFDASWAPIIGCAGPIAEARFTGEPAIWSGAGTDLCLVFPHLPALEGTGDNVRVAGDDIERRTQEFVEAYWVQIARLAEALLKYGTVTGGQIERILSGKTRPRRTAAEGA